MLEVLSADGVLVHAVEGDVGRPKRFSWMLSSSVRVGRGSRCCCVVLHAQWWSHGAGGALGFGELLQIRGKLAPGLVCEHPLEAAFETAGGEDA